MGGGSVHRRCDASNGIAGDVLCHAVLCRAVPCCAVLCSAVLVATGQQLAGCLPAPLPASLLGHTVAVWLRVHR